MFNNRVTSIEIGMYQTRVCEVDYRRKVPHVHRCISFATPKNAYEDGYICNTEVIAEVLREKLKESNLKSKRLVFTIASTKIASREVSIPFVKEQRIGEIVKANASEYFPVDIKGFIIRYSVLEKYNVEGEKRLRLLILAAPENMIKSYYDLADDLGSEIAAIDYIGNSIFQIVRHSDSGNHLLVHISDQMTFLNILEKGALSHPKTVYFGLVNLLDAMKLKEPNLKSEEEALQLLAGDSNAGWQQDATLQYLVNSILRILDSGSKNQEKKPHTIFLTGAASRVSGMKEFLQNELEIEVVYPASLLTISFDRELDISDKEREDYAACIGAAINPIGFLPGDHQARNRKNNHIQNLVFTIMAGVLISTLLVSSSYFSYKSQLLKNRTLSEGLSKLPEINRIYENYNLAAGQKEKLKTLSDMTKNPNDHILELLAQLEQKLPSDVVVKAFSVNSQGITLSLRGSSEVTAAKALQQLKEIPFLSQIKTDAITFSEDENKIVSVYFIIQGTYTMDRPWEVDDGITKENIGS